MRNSYFRGSVKTSGDVFSVKHRVLRLLSAFCIVDAIILTSR